MDNQKSKKKSPVLFFLASFLAVLIITVIANRQSALVKEITIPMNNGILSLSTYDNLLTAVSFDNKAYIIEWNNLSKKYLTIPVAFDQMAMLGNGTTISVLKYNAKSVVFADIKGDRNKKEMSLAAGENKAFLKIGRHCSKPILVLAQAKPDGVDRTVFTFYTIDPNKEYLQFEFTADLQIDINQRINAAVSDDGRLVSLCGGESPPSAGWIALYDTEERKLLWESRLPNPALFFNCEFSADSKLIYARGSDSSVYKFDSSNGQMVGQLMPKSDNASTLTNKHVQSVEISSDGSLVGAVVGSKVYIWEQATGRKVFSKSPAHKLISDIAFSPDSKFLATADVRQGGKIKIWRIPGR